MTPSVSFRDLSKIVEALSVLDLGDDLNVLAILTEDLANGSDILTTSDKRSKDHIHIVLDAKSEIGLVLLGKSREIDISIWKVDALLGRDFAIVASTDTDSLGVDNGEDIESKDTIINVDDTAGLNHLGDVLVVNVPR
jgi:hypothetical protein